jgi:ribosomal-protein-alanine N-acetyltransferase
MTEMDIDEVVLIDSSSFSLPWPRSSFEFEVRTSQASLPLVAELRPQGQTPHIIGMIVCWVTVDEIHIATIAVSETWRFRGIGSLLLASALQRGYNLGGRKAFLEVRRGNLAAQRMYERFGFKLTSVRPRYYRDSHEDALLMDLDPIEPSRLAPYLMVK